MKNIGNENMDRMFDQLKSSFLKHCFISEEAYEQFSQFIWQDPDKALDSLIEWYDKSLDKAYINENGKNYRDLIEMTCGGPYEAIPSALYNSIGSIYPLLNRELKNKALGKILGVLDKINSKYITISHTPYIKEPLLLSDISISRPLYWPGLEEGERIIKNTKLFSDFKVEYLTENGFFKKGKVDSDFISAYSLLRSDFSSWGEDYAEVVNKSFLDRVVQGIVAKRFAFHLRLKSLSEDEKKELDNDFEVPDFYSKNEEKLILSLEKEILHGKNRLRELLPIRVHDKIEEKIIKKDWADPLYFWDHKKYFLKASINEIIRR